ncbi:MAG: LemA family protein, partial [bacterium]|nr:LemA family protein [bacterium]
MKQRGSVWVVLLIVLGVVVLIGITLASSYNRFVSLSQEVDNQFAIIESKLQRRFDLIPNLVESVKGAMAQEQKVFGDIAAARAKMAGATSVSDKVQASNEMESALSRLLVVMENYPTLNSIDTVKSLMD